MNKTKRLTSQEREDLIKNRMNVYCNYLMDQSSDDILEMVETNTMTVADAMLKRREDERD